MNKKECVIKSAYVRKDVDGSILSYVVSVQDVNAKSDYTYRFDFWKASFEKTFWKNESNLNTLVGSKCYLVESLSLN